MNKSTAIRVAFAVAALPAVVRAAVRCGWWERRLPLDGLVERLRSTPRFSSAALAHPEWLLAIVDRLLPLLPPWRYGRCLKRSLLLLDLWSRCGLRPALHLGVRRADEGVREGHAWVTAEEAASGQGPLATSAEGYREAFRL